MEITEVTPVKKSAFQLVEGDVIVSAGKKLVFLRFKKGGKSFVAQSVNEPDKKYQVRINFGSEFMVIGKMQIEKIASEIDILRRSPEGTLFVINNKKSAELFKLVSFSPSGKIKATNPITGDGFSIDPSFAVKLVSNLS